MDELSHALDSMTLIDARDALTRCCGATRWVDAMLALRPYASDGALFAAADCAWSGCGEADYLEAFRHHPQIGASLAALRARFPSTSLWSGAEQAGMDEADEATLRALRDANHAYFARFGYIFIICATGKSAPEMLAALQQRMPNDAAQELQIAAAEQHKITQLRLRKLV